MSEPYNLIHVGECDVPMIAHPVRKRLQTRCHHTYHSQCISSSPVWEKYEASNRTFSRFETFKALQLSKCRQVVNADVPTSISAFCIEAIPFRQWRICVWQPNFSWTTTTWNFCYRAHRVDSHFLSDDQRAHFHVFRRHSNLPFPFSEHLEWKFLTNAFLSGPLEQDRSNGWHRWRPC